MPLWRVRGKGIVSNLPNDPLYESVSADDAHVNGAGDLLFWKRNENNPNSAILVASFAVGAWDSIRLRTEPFPLTEEETAAHQNETQ
jgi:hypothetical protein